MDFIAPELLSGDMNDKNLVWSLGILLYYLLGGKPYNVPIENISHKSA